jgi:hypothetical protein
MPRLPKKWNIALKVLPFAVGAIALKYAIHVLGWEAISLNPEQSALRRTFTRVRMIRDTSFVASGYAIAEIISVLLIVGFLISKIDPFYESLFFVGLITFFLIYMLALIKDLDNPFEYGAGGSDADEVSLLPIDEVRTRLHKRMEELPA